MQMNSGSLLSSIQVAPSESGALTESAKKAGGKAMNVEELRINK